MFHILAIVNLLLSHHVYIFYYFTPGRVPLGLCQAALLLDWILLWSFYFAYCPVFDENTACIQSSSLHSAVRLVHLA